MARVAIGAEEKKKLYVLGGLLAAIIVVVFVLYRPTGNTPTDDPAPTEKSKPAEAPKAGEGAPAGDAPKADGAAGGGGTGGSGAGGITAASLVSVSEYRGDPFEPVPLPPPLPTPPPPPPPPPPVSIEPPSIFISQPGGNGLGGGLPPFIPGGGSFGGTPPSRILRDLPPPYIPRVAIAPRAPSNFTPPGGQITGGGMRSPNKRLSGVIIGDSVRALLVIESGGQGGMGGQGEVTSVTRIVQPGDEVDGIRILRIERTTEGGRPVVRMFIRENGEERFVDLRPAPQQTGQGGAGGVGGLPGGRAPF